MKSLFVLLNGAILFSAAQVGSIGAEGAASTNSTPAPSRAQQEGALTRENINDAQRSHLREANEKFRQEQTTLYEKLRTARRDLEQTAQSNTADEDAIRQKAAVLGQIEGDLAILRAKHYKELRAILPHEQAARQSGLAGTNSPLSSRLQEVVRKPATNAPVSAPSRPQ